MSSASVNAPDSRPAADFSREQERPSLAKRSRRAAIVLFTVIGALSFAFQGLVDTASASEPLQFERLPGRPSAAELAPAFRVLMGQGDRAAMAKMARLYRKDLSPDTRWFGARGPQGHLVGLATLHPPGSLLYLMHNHWEWDLAFGPKGPQATQLGVEPFNLLVAMRDQVVPQLGGDVFPLVFYPLDNADTINFWESSYRRSARGLRSGMNVLPFADVGGYTGWYIDSLQATQGESTGIFSLRTAMSRGASPAELAAMLPTSYRTFPLLPEISGANNMLSMDAARLASHSVDVNTLWSAMPELHRIELVARTEGLLAHPEVLRLIPPTELNAARIVTSAAKFGIP